jgi:uncharacterized membrane protein
MMRVVAGAETSEREPEFRLRTARMEAFSDGVFAIAITLLVLELAVPESDVESAGKALLEQWPMYLAYVVSFASIGTVWLMHSLITDHLARADSIFLRLNLLLLFFVSLVPFPTHMLSNFIDNPNAERVAAAIYGINLIAMAAMTSVLWHYAVSENLVQPDKDSAEVRAITKKLEPGLATYVAAIAIGLLLPRAAVVLYGLIALYILIPFRAIRNWIRRSRA